MKYVILACLLTTTSMAADLAGVTLGGHADAAMMARLGIEAGTPSHVEQGRYRGAKRLELVDTKTAVEINADGMVTSVVADFPTLQAESVRDMALRKWGKPFDSGVAVMPDGNLEKIWIWETRDGAEITVCSYDPAIPAGSLTRGSITMISKAAAEAKRGPKGDSL